MARPRKASDEEILQHALALMEERGSDALTFALLAERSGLSGSTLVQRFGTKQRLIETAIASAWDALDGDTQRAVEAAQKTPAGAVALLCRLSEDYGDDVEGYADKLRLLREDLRNPAFRARGKAWVDKLAGTVDACVPNAPKGFGRQMVAQWQGALLLWAFAPDRALVVFLKDHLEQFLKTQGRWPNVSASPSKRPKR